MRHFCQPYKLMCFIVLLLSVASIDTHLILANSADVQKEDPVKLEDLTKLQAECAKERKRIQQMIAALEEESDELPPEYLVTELDLWERLELLAAQRKSTQEDLVETKRQLQLAKERHLEIESAGTVTAKSHSFLKLDEARDEMIVAQREVEMLELELEAEKALLLDAKDQLNDTEHARRSIAESLETADSKDITSQLRERTLLELRSRVLKCETALHREGFESLEQSMLLAETKVQELQNRVRVMAQGVQFSEKELKKLLGIIDEVEKNIQEQLGESDRRLRRAMRNRSRKDSSSSPNTAFETAKDETQLLQQILIEVNGIRDCWHHRYALVNGKAKPGEPDEWLKGATASKRHIDRLAEKLRLRIDLRQSSLSSLKGKARSGEIEDKQLQSLNNQIADLERAVEFYSTTQVLVAGGLRLYERFITELEYHLDKLTWAEFVERIEAWVGAIWSYEITTIDDKAITVSKIVCGMALLFCGYWISRFVAATIAYRVLPKFGLSETAIAPLRTVLFYGLLVAFAFISLDVVNVPLTVFAFMGGAIAIGVGFGSQNILNNFISGLILLVERPIRIGDLVNVEGIDANIEQIGARSTRVRTGSNLEILVPNSKFLENNVTNWTLSDTRIRTVITVGVAYGSPVKSVIELLNSIVSDQAKVLDNPAPIVLFKDFGDNSLAFEVHFWVHMRRMMDSARIESDIRVEIDERFHEAGITIAYPQRDVHLDLQKPIEVRLREATNPTLKVNPTQEAA